MKTKFYWFALLASAALIAQAQAGGHHGGGGGGGHFAPARGGASSFHSMPGRRFGSGRMINPGRQFSAGGMRHFNSAGINRSDRIGRFGNNPRFAQGRNGLGQARAGRNLPANWRNHVVAQHSGNWHHDWNRGRDHWWHGHRCRFVNGSWVIFDSGFYPWWGYGYPYGYGYYGYDYYPYGYSSGYYDPGYYGGEDYYGENGYDSSDASVAAAQERLASRGYYDGQVDGVLGPQTRRAIARYQNNHGQRATGHLTPSTLQALGLRRVASY